MRRHLYIAAAVALVPGAAIGTRMAAAQEPPAAVTLVPGPRVVEAPTAWLPPRNTILVTAGADATPNADQTFPFVAVSAGLEHRRRGQVA
jgi:hypothetical protein